MSMDNKVRLILLAVSIIIGMGIKINYDNKQIQELNKEINKTEEIQNSYDNKIDKLNVIIDNLEEKIYDLENMATDGTKDSDINYFELREEILGFDIRDIEAADKRNWYYYNTLSDYEKADYIKILYCLSTMGSTSDLKETNKEKVGYIYKCVCMDHETLFWVNDYSYNYSEEWEKYIFYGDYENDLCINTVNLYNAWCDIKDYRDDVISQLNHFMTDAEKELLIFNYIVTHTTYEKGSFQNQSLYSVVREKSVCAGMSKMFKYICEEVGIKCICVLGTHRESEIGHMWNIVQIGNHNYMVDTTNGLSRFSNGAIFVNYDYFNTSREQLEKGYLINEKYTLPM